MIPGEWQQGDDEWLPTSFVVRSFEAIGSALTRTPPPGWDQWWDSPPPAVIPAEGWGSEAKEWPTMAAYHAFPSANNSPPPPGSGTVRVHVWARNQKPIASAWPFRGDAMAYRDDSEGVGYWQTAGPVLNGFMPDQFPNIPPPVEEWPAGVIGVEVDWETREELERRLGVRVLAEDRDPAWGPPPDPVTVTGGAAVLGATKVTREGPLSPEGHLGHPAGAWGPSVVLRQPVIGYDYWLGEAELTQFAPTDGPVDHLFPLPVVGDDVVAVMPVFSPAQTRPDGHFLWVQVNRVDCHTLVRPPRWRYLYADEDAGGLWRLRQRQSLPGADSWPLRQRQSGNATGSWPLRQRQGGV